MTATDDFKSAIDERVSKLFDTHLMECLGMYLDMSDRAFRDEKVAYALKALKAEAAKRGLV